jgi:hypothetical protein
MADKALLLGINDYRHISDLRGCLNDVRNIQSLLADVFEFRGSNIHTLTDADVVKENIEREWDWLYENAGDGDRLVVHYSGHGSYTTDLDEDEPDGADELICLYDMDWDDDQTYLLDDELRELTSRVPAGAQLTVIFDSCHSGTATRMTVALDGKRTVVRPESMPLVDLSTTLARTARKRGSRSLTAAEADVGQTLTRVFAPKSASEDRDVVRVRFVEPPRKVLEALYRYGVRSSLRGGRGDRRRSAMNHVLLAGSKDTQTSADAFIDGDFNGAFSYYFCETIREAGPQIDQRDLIGKVRTALADNQFSQIPQLEPDSAQGPVFGSLGGATSAGHAANTDVVDRATTRELVKLLREVKSLLASSRASYGRQTC